MAADLQEPPELVVSFVEQLVSGGVDLVLGGSLGGRRNPSVIRNLVTGDVVRAG